MHGGSDAHDGLGRAGAEGHHGEPDEETGHAETGGQIGGAADQEFSAEGEENEAKEEKDDLDRHGGRQGEEAGGGAVAGPFP